MNGTWLALAAAGGVALLGTRGPRSGSAVDAIDTPAFRRWFGASKVVDENGRPLVVYHGTNTDFDAFNTRRVRDANRMGAYFTSDREAAGRMHGHRRLVVPVYLSMQKPLDTREIAREDLPERLLPSVPHIRYERHQGRAGHYAMLEHLDRKYDLVPKLKRRGFDGIIFPDQVEGDTYVVFRPTQIKSALANVGTFDPEDPRISYNRVQP